MRSEISAAWEMARTAVGRAGRAVTSAACGMAQPWGDPPPAGYSLRERLGWGLPAIGIYALGYYGTEYLGMLSPKTYDVRLPWDHHIPLRTEFAFGYAMIYVLLLLMVFIRQRETYLDTLRGIAIQSVVCFSIYLAFPVRMLDRPDEEVFLMQGAGASLLGFFYAVDLPYNLFPSMHLSLSAFVAMMVAADIPRLKWPLVLSVSWIALSVLLTRQHYILDAFAGLAVAYLTRRALLPAVNGRWQWWRQRAPVTLTHRPGI